MLRLGDKWSSCCILVKVYDAERGSTMFFTNIDFDLTIVNQIFVKFVLPSPIHRTKKSMRSTDNFDRCKTNKGENRMMLAMYNNCVSALQRRFSKDEQGQTMVEYVMLIVLVALAVFILTPNIKDAILKVFQNTSSALK